MSKLAIIIINIGLVISLLFGLWHFSVPYIFNWYDYIPDAPKAIIISIDLINLFFSFLLSGISLILLIHQKDIINKNKVSYSFFTLILITWFLRFLLSIIYPINPEYTMTDKIQILIFGILFIFLTIPYFYYLFRKLKN